MTDVFSVNAPMPFASSSILGEHKTTSVQSETVHVPASLKEGTSPTLVGVMLTKPELVRGGGDLSKIESKLKSRFDCDLDIILAMMQCYREQRRMSFLLRDTENDASILALKEQVDQMNAGARLMIASAVVAAAGAVAALGVGGWGLSRNASAIHQEKTLEVEIASRNTEIKSALADPGETIDNNLKDLSPEKVQKELGASIGTESVTDKSIEMKSIGTDTPTVSKIESSEEIETAFGAEPEPQVPKEKLATLDESVSDPLTKTKPESHDEGVSDALAESTAPVTPMPAQAKSVPVTDKVDVAVLEQNNHANVIAVKNIGRTIDQRSTKVQLINTVARSFGDMSNASIQVWQNGVQAQAKAYEVAASIDQFLKQKASDQLQYLDTSLKELLQMVQQITQNNTQAMRAAGNVA